MPYGDGWAPHHLGFYPIGSIRTDQQVRVCVRVSARTRVCACVRVCDCVCARARACVCVIKLSFVFVQPLPLHLTSCSSYISPNATLLTSCVFFSQENMPIEETGNLLMMIAAAAQATGSNAEALKFVYPHYWPLIQSWGEYLITVLPGAWLALRCVLFSLCCLSFCFCFSVS